MRVVVTDGQKDRQTHFMNTFQLLECVENYDENVKNTSNAYITATLSTDKALTFF